MSKENAKDFVQAILNDEELRQRTEKMKPEDAVPLGKEMGYDFTLEEFTDVMNEDRELSPDELESVAGGDYKARMQAGYWEQVRGLNTKYKDYKTYQTNKANFCPDGSPHQWTERIEDNSFFGLWTRTYLVMECSNCKRKAELHIKFGENGEIEYDF